MVAFYHGFCPPTAEQSFCFLKTEKDKSVGVRELILKAEVRQTTSKLLLEFQATCTVALKLRETSIFLHSSLKANVGRKSASEEYPYLHG